MAQFEHLPISPTMIVSANTSASTLLCVQFVEDNYR
jgi:hypothetical protein